jgi:hypothetical protein
VKVSPQAADHVVFSEQDSIPHSTYQPTSKSHRAKDTCGKLINDMDRIERKQIPKATNSSMGNILNHDVPQVSPRL